MPLTWTLKGQYAATAASLLIALGQLLYLNSLLAAALTLAAGLWVSWNRNDTVTQAEWRLLIVTATTTTLFLSYPWLRRVLPYHYNLVAFAVMAVLMLLFVPPVWRRIGGGPHLNWRRLLPVAAAALILVPTVSAAPATVALPSKPAPPAWCDDVLRISRVGAPVVEIPQHRVKVSKESASTTALSIDLTHKFRYGACLPPRIIDPAFGRPCTTVLCPQQVAFQCLPEADCGQGGEEICLMVYPTQCGGRYREIPRPIGCLRLACPNVWVTPGQAHIEIQLTFGRTRHTVVDETQEIGGGFVLARQSCLRALQCGLDADATPFHATVSLSNDLLNSWGFPDKLNSIYVVSKVTYTFRDVADQPLVCRIGFQCAGPVGGERSAQATVIDRVRLNFGAYQLKRLLPTLVGDTSSLLWNSVDDEVPGLGLGALLQPGLVDQVRSP